MIKPNQNTNELTEVRFHFKHRGNFRKIVKIAFSKTDASLYIFPYGQTGECRYGIETFAEHELKKSFDCNNHQQGKGTAKLSYHESGQLHVICPGYPRAGPIHTDHLKDWRGQHIATVTSDFKALPINKNPLRNAGKKIDHYIDAPDEIESARISFYCNGFSPVFPVQVLGYITMRRTTNINPIHIGFTAFGQNVLDVASNTGGVIATAGWKTKGNIDQKEHFIFIWSE